MDPSFYAHPVERVDYLQTHISSIFLTGDYAYKLKKPVDFGFLDFTTPEKRRINCEAEVELNRRLAPAVYLRVAPICLVDGKPVFDGPGEAIDSLVVMRQMDNDRLGPEVLARVRQIPGFAGTPVIFLTGVINGGELKALRDSGAADVILKPFDPMTLAGRVDRIWDSVDD